MHFSISRLAVAIPLLILASCADDDSLAGGGRQDAAAIVDPNCPTEGAVLHELLEGDCVTGAACPISVQFLCEPGVQYVTGLREYACSCSTGKWSCSLTSSGLSLNPCDGGAVDAASE